MNENNTTRDITSHRLRECIPLMRDRGPDFGPHSYAVWYAYKSGAPRWLVDRVDAALQTTGRLDDDTADQLCRRLVAEDAEVPGLSPDEIVEAIERLNNSARTAQTATARVMVDLDGVDAERDPVQLARRVRSFRATLGQFASEIRQATAELELLRANLDEMRQQAQLDSLTGLANRRAFDTFLKEHIDLAKSSGRPVSLVLLDLDHFKAINDSHGHAFGDQVIRRTAEVLRRHCQPTEMAARVGGEEFGLVLPDTGERDAWIRAEKIRSAVGTATIRNETGDVLERITLSGGVAVHRAGEQAAQTFERSDQALYLAKRNGRDRVEIAP